MTIYTFYQIVCNDKTVKESYVGSSVNFKDRKSRHKCNCNSPNSKCYNFKIYKFIRDNGGWNNFNFITLKEIVCADKYEAHKIEQSYINELNPELNERLSYTGLTKLEYSKKYNLDYNRNHKQYFKEYYKQYSQDNKKYNKQYKKDNEQILKQYNKQYRILNKEKINEAYCCLICKGPYTNSNLARHEKTNKHKNSL